ncbi:hypothetical protein GCM10009577_24370 [Streptomyces javensis]
MEGAQALEVATPRVPQLEVFGYDGVDRDRCPYRLHVVIVDPACHARILRPGSDMAIRRLPDPGVPRSPRAYGRSEVSGTAGSARVVGSSR